MALPSRRTALLLVCILGAFIAGFLLPAPDRSAPVAERGEIDLTKWNFAEMGSAQLNGEWSFYWQQMLGQDALASSAAAPTGFLRMPGSWRGYQSGAGRLPGTGYATLRLRVDLPDHTGRLVLEIPTLFSAYRLWANGRLVAAAGTVGTSAATEHPQYRPQMAILEPGASTLDLVLQISDFHHSRSGSVSGIKLGNYRELLLAKRTASILKAGLFGALAFLGLQNLFLFLRRRQQKAHLIGGSFILVGSVTVAVVYDLIFADLPPGFGWEFHWKIEYAGGFLLLILAIWLAQILFPHEAGSDLLRRAMILVAGAGVALVIFTPALIYTSTQPFFHLLGALTIVYLLDIGIRAIGRGRPYAWTFLLTAMVIAAWMAAEWPRYYGIPREDILLEPIPLLAILLGLAVIYLLEHGRLADTSTALLSENAELTTSLRSKVAELRAARQLLATQEEEQHRKIAEFLHSRVQSRLLVVGFHLSQAGEWLSTNPSGAASALETARRLTDEIREKDIRLVSHLLHPTAITVGLVPAVNSLSADFARHFHTEVALTPAVAALDDVSYNRIPEPVRTAAYRVLAEALGNVQAHAQATRVRIALSRTPDGHLTMEVADNGRGFDTGAVTPGLGLRTMAARLAECGGSLELESQPGRSGTRLRVRIPLGAAAVEAAD